MSTAGPREISTASLQRASRQLAALEDVAIEEGLEPPAWVVAARHVVLQELEGRDHAQ
jgi:hypothetical protein